MVRAISIPTQKGNNYKNFVKGRQQLRDLIGGTVEYDATQDMWIYWKDKNRVNGKIKIAIGATAEGIKKIAILNQLLGNHYLDSRSIIIFDEPEAGLHPAAVSELMDIILLLAETGIQVFIASHSYFVLKKAYLLARQNNTSIPIMSLESESDIRYHDLLNGLPENAIMQESIRLYEEEVDEVL